MIRKWLVGLVFTGSVFAHDCPLWAPIMMDDITVVFRLYDSPNTKPDADCDGLSDEDERRLGTDMYDYDTDNDGYSDYHDDYPLDAHKSTDTTPPVLTLKGSKTVTLSLYAPFNDAGASAVDDRDGSVSVRVSGRVNSFVPGTYRIIYTATDSRGNRATAVRTVVVKSKVAPQIVSDGSDVKDAYGDKPTQAVKAFLGAFVSGDRPKVEEAVGHDARILSILYGNSGATDFLKGLYRTVYSIKSESHGKGRASVIIGFAQTKDKSHHFGGFELSLAIDQKGKERWTITWFY